MNEYGGYKVGQTVRFHPIIGLKHDGNLWKILGFHEIGNGEICAKLEGKSGVVAIEALSEYKSLCA